MNYNQREEKIVYNQSDNHSKKEEPNSQQSSRSFLDFDIMSDIFVDYFLNNIYD